MKDVKQSVSVEQSVSVGEPVAWMDADGNVSDNNDHKCFPIPLYTTPQPKREWIGLTEKEQDEVFKTFSRSDAYKRDFLNRVARAIETKIKEKNT